MNTDKYKQQRHPLRLVKHACNALTSSHKRHFQYATIAMNICLATACGGSGDNVNLNTLGDDVAVEQTNHYYTPNAFFDGVQYVSETLQFQSGDSYRLFTYDDTYTGEEDKTTILADGLPGETLYARVLVTGLATHATAEVSISS